MRDYMIRRSFRGLGFVAPMLDTGATGVSFTSGGPTLTAANPPSKSVPGGYSVPGGGLVVAGGTRTAPPPTTSITKTPSGEILGASAGPRTAASFPGTADSPPVVPTEDPEALAAAERTTTSSPDLPAAPVVYSSGGSTSMSWESLPPWARVAILLGVIGAGAGGAFLFLRRRPRRR